MGGFRSRPFSLRKEGGGVGLLAPDAPLYVPGFHVSKFTSCSIMSSIMSNIMSSSSRSSSSNFLHQTSRAGIYASLPLYTCTTLPPPQR